MPAALRRRDGYYWGAASAVAVSFLIALAVAYSHRNDCFAGLIDEAEYNRLALAILGGGRYDSTYWLPGFPAFAAGVYAVCGRSLLNVYIAHAFLWAICLGLIHSIALRTTQNRTTAFVALLMCILWWPFYTNLVPRMMTEMLASVLLAGALLACLAARDRQSAPIGLLTGVLLGLGTLTKSVVLALLPFAAAYLGWGNRKNMRAALLLLLGWGLVTGPWIMRNYRVTGDFVPVSTGGGYNFWFGNHPEVYKRRVNDARELIAEVQDSLKGKKDVARDKVFFKLAVERMRQHPLESAGIMAQKLSKLWLGKLGMSPNTAPGPIRSAGTFGVPPGSLVRLGLMGLAILGWFALPADAKRSSRPLVVVLAVWTLCYVVLTAEPRYAYPVQFYQIILAAPALQWLLDRLLARAAALRRVREAAQ